MNGINKEYTPVWLLKVYHELVVGVIAEHAKYWEGEAEKASRNKSEECKEEARKYWSLCDELYCVKTKLGIE